MLTNARLPELDAAKAAWEETPCEATRNQILLAAQPVIKITAWRFAKGTGVSHDDAVQIANLLFLRMSEHATPAKGDPWALFWTAVTNGRLRDEFTAASPTLALDPGPRALRHLAKANSNPAAPPAPAAVVRAVYAGPPVDIAALCNAGTRVSDGRREGAERAGHAALRVPHPHPDARPMDSDAAARAFIGTAIDRALARVTATEKDYALSRFDYLTGGELGINAAPLRRTPSGSIAVAKDGNGAPINWASLRTRIAGYVREELAALKTGEKEI